jgi:hypothetical protein
MGTRLENTRWAQIRIICADLRDFSCANLWVKIFSVIFLIAVPSLTQAFPNEPNGFGGMSWWRSLADLDDIAIFEDIGVYKYGYRQDEEFSFGMAELERIVYCFYQNKFFAVYIQAKDFANAELLRRELLHRYGVPSGSRRKFELYWQGEITEIAYTFDPVTEVCRVVFISKELLERILSITRTWPVDEQGYDLNW